MKGPPLRGSIVGFGTAGQTHAAAYVDREDFVIDAIVDPSPTRRAAAQELLPAARVHASLDALADAGVPDFLDVCCPPRWHIETVITGLNLGCHVLCEKPLFPMPGDAKRVRTALSVAPGVLYPCHNYKFAPVLQRMRLTILSRRFGEVRSGRFRTLRTRPAAGVLGWQPDWRREATLAGGGILQDHGTHAVYLATYLTGLKPVWTACTTSRSKKLTPRTDTEDAAHLTIGLEGGAELAIELTWTSPRRHTSYAIVGRRESVQIEDMRFTHATGTRTLASATVTDFTDTHHLAWLDAMLNDFLALVATPSRQEALLTEAERAAHVIACAYASADCGGEPIAVPEPGGRDVRDSSVSGLGECHHIGVESTSITHPATREGRP